MKTSPPKCAQIQLFQIGMGLRMAVDLPELESSVWRSLVRTYQYLHQSNHLLMLTCS